MDESEGNAGGVQGEADRPSIRARRDGDVAACVVALAEVHAASGYPLHWPADPKGWLTPGNMLAAWVAEVEGVVAGHVALCSATGDSGAAVWAAASGVAAEGIAVVAKLFVAPSRRGRGLGAALLGAATAEARTRGLRPALEVLDSDRAAIALYERSGWVRVASEPLPWAQANGAAILAHFYLESVGVGGAVSRKSGQRRRPQRRARWSVFSSIMASPTSGTSS